jgi:hypothetical protein
MNVRLMVMRAVKFKIDHLRAITDSPEGSSFEEMERSLKERYSPLGYGLKVLPVDPKATDYPWVYFAIEAMSWDIKDAHVPHSAFVTTDPLDHRETLLMDGRLEGELNRIGIPAQAKDFEWYALYTTSGN